MADADREVRGFDRVAHRLDSWKRQLIDLTRRNRLLNYRATKRSTVEVVDEIPQQVFTQLLAGERFRFDPKPEEEEPAEAEAQRELEPEQKRDLQARRALEALRQTALEDFHTDDRLQTRYTEKRLEGNLLQIYRRASESIEEQGVNTLFLALGMLEWYEDRGSEVVNRAPLVMVPVMLSRRTAASPFLLDLREDDVLLNPAIVEKLRLDFKLNLPGLPEQNEDIDLDQLFDQVEETVSGFPRWRLTSDIALGLFSFQKFIMYRDIERHEEKFREHEVIRSICREGEEEIIAGIPPEIEGADLNEAMAPWETIQVVDADSSQQRAMLAVRNGYNLVIEGPPGTGKSQTITNLIADAISHGKKVLFVSEKMAALEVVKSRIETVDLGNYCLELHSNKASKREFVGGLARSLDADPPLDSDNHRAQLSELRRLTNELQDYVVALHEPGGELHLSPFKAIGRLVEVEDSPKVRAEIPGLLEVDHDDLDAAIRNLTELVRALRDVGDPAEHPLRGIDLTMVGRGDADRIRDTSEAAGEALLKLTEAIHAVVDLFGFRAPDTIQDVRLLSSSAKLVATAPGGDRSVLESDRWNDMSAEAERILETGERFADLRQNLRPKFRPEILEEDLRAEVGIYEELLERGLLRFFFPSYWKTRSVLREFLLPSYRPDDAEKLLTDIKEAISCRREMLQLADLDEAGRELFGSKWNGKNSDWSELREFAEWLVQFRRYALKEVIASRGLEVAAGGGPADKEACDEAIQRLDSCLSEVEDAISELSKVARLDADESEIDVAPGTRLGPLAQRIGEIESNLDKLRSYSIYRGAKKECEEDLTCDFVVQAIEEKLEPHAFVPSFKRLFYEQWLDWIMGERGTLGRFRSSTHEELIENFRGLDRTSLESARQRARLSLEEMRRDMLRQEVTEQLQLVQREARKQRRIMPIRKLLKRAPDVVQRIKPCFMMSPLSVAQYVDPDSMHFDLLIFDEASQIPPADAIGSIIRADQVVVVGDSKQLPPTNFFGVHLDDADTEEEEEVELLSDLESILDEGAVSGMPSLRLKWHYRSHHESLIRFSNEEFYSDDPLYTFPSPVRDGDDLGLQFEFLEEAIYEGGGVNSVEARRVAEAVVRHIHEHPQLTLGVGTFGISQQGRILDELDRLRREDPSIEWFFNREGEQKFFVKNLENIQGDDRDVIFLSVTYGPDEDGQVRRNFGPINRDGGWRRLNVLTTRAKRRLKVFSSMRGDQIDTGNVARGAVLLRQYLKYAQTGVYERPKISVGEPDSPFERAVLRALEERGYRTVAQVGEAAYRIDIGIVDRERPGRYICGIECDGASYHSAATARDRDRLRQDVLEDRGWDIHRVWSTDWFHDKGGQIERLVDLIEESRKSAAHTRVQRSSEPRPPEDPVDAVGSQHPDSGSDPSDAPPLDDRPDLEEIDVPPYRFTQVEVVAASDDFYTASVDKICRLVDRVVSVEGPIHLEELARRVASFWGLKRLGSQIRSRVSRAAENLCRRGELEKDGDFVWQKGLDPIPVRCRDVDGATFQSDTIAPCEIREAVRTVLRHRAPLMPEEVVVETARLLGFSRTGKNLREVIEDAREELVENGELRAGGFGVGLAE